MRFAERRRSIDCSGFQNRFRLRLATNKIYSTVLFTLENNSVGKRAFLIGSRLFIFVSVEISKLILLIIRAKPFKIDILFPWQYQQFSAEQMAGQLSACLLETKKSGLKNMGIYSNWRQVHPWTHTEYFHQ